MMMNLAILHLFLVVLKMADILTVLVTTID